MKTIGLCQWQPQQQPTTVYWRCQGHDLPAMGLGDGFCHRRVPGPRCLPGSGTCHPAKSARTLVRGPALGFLGLGHLPKAPPSGRCRMTWCSGLLHHRRGGAGGHSQPSPQQGPSSTQGGLRRSGLSLQANAADSRLIRNGMWVRRCKDGSSPQFGTAATRTSAKKQRSRYRPWLLEHLPQRRHRPHAGGAA